MIKIKCTEEQKLTLATTLLNKLIIMHLNGASIEPTEENIEKSKKIFAASEELRVQITSEGVYTDLYSNDSTVLDLVDEIMGTTNYEDNFTGEEMKKLLQEILEEFPGVDIEAKYVYESGSIFLPYTFKVVKGKLKAKGWN